MFKSLDANLPPTSGMPAIKNYLSCLNSSPLSSEDSISSWDCCSRYCTDSVTSQVFRQSGTVCPVLRISHSLQVDLPFAHTNAFKYSFFPLSMSAWNSLSNESVISSSHSSFMRQLKSKSCYAF